MVHIMCRSSGATVVDLVSHVHALFDNKSQVRVRIGLQFKHEELIDSSLSLTRVANVDELQTIIGQPMLNRPVDSVASLEIELSAPSAALDDERCRVVRAWWKDLIALARHIGRSSMRPRLALDVLIDGAVGLSASARYRGWAFAATGLFNEDPTDFFWRFFGVPLRERDAVMLALLQQCGAYRVGEALRSKFCAHDTFWFRRDGMWDTNRDLPGFEPPLPDNITRQDVDTSYALQKAFRCTAGGSEFDRVPEEIREVIFRMATPAHRCRGSSECPHPAGTENANVRRPAHVRRPSEASADGSDWNESVRHVAIYTNIYDDEDDGD